MGKLVKPENPAPGEDVFTEDDLVPDSADERRAQAEGSAQARRFTIDKIATVVATLAFGMIAGGMIALGACAAPEVFKLPDPLSGNTMGAAFSRFDTVAITCALIALGAEVVRTVITLRVREARAWLPRVRRYLAILLALGTLYIGLHLSPQIMTAYQSGVRRNVGAEGATLEQAHKQAETIGKFIVLLASTLIGLHIFTLKSTPGSDAGLDDP